METNDNQDPESAAMMTREKTGSSESSHKKKVVNKGSVSCNLNNKECTHVTVIIPPGNGTKIKNQKSAPCDDDWIQNRGKCYYFSNESDTWRNSEKFCNSHNSSLAIIDSKVELNFLFRYKGKGDHWIGIRRTDDNMAWTWTNGTLYNESLFHIESNKNDGKVFLNNNSVKSQDGFIISKYICTKV
ncbi:C-type lectin domain family 2 member A-like isoform 2-T2 [Anomaloglossus baeobatrachus]|uniref:C-type lectin domain family 2 member A-like n=1 Tax=Anomaloglossus baeobatrachus TaxID=238106 RepID=UPI003F506E02